MSIRRDAAPVVQTAGSGVGGGKVSLLGRGRKERGEGRGRSASEVLLASKKIGVPESTSSSLSIRRGKNIKIIRRTSLPQPQGGVQQGERREEKRREEEATHRVDCRVVVHGRDALLRVLRGALGVWCVCVQKNVCEKQHRRRREGRARGEVHASRRAGAARPLDVCSFLKSSFCDPHRRFR